MLVSHALHIILHHIRLRNTIYMLYLVLIIYVGKHNN